MNISQNWRLNGERYYLRCSEDAQGYKHFPPQPDIERRLLAHYEWEIEAEGEADQQTGSEVLAVGVLGTDTDTEDTNTKGTKEAA